MPATAMNGDPANYGNPADGKFVIGNPFTACKGASYGAYIITGWNGTVPVYDEDDTNYSTGGLNTGIGYGPQVIESNAADFKASGFQENMVLGSQAQPASGGVVAVDTTYQCIGGGKTVMVDGTGANGNGTPVGTQYSNPVPFGSLQIVGFGNGGSRDAGTNGTGFGVRASAASATVAEGAVITGTWVNRSGRTLVNGERTFGSGNAANAAVAPPSPRP